MNNKKIVEMTKEEKFRVKGLNRFIEGANKTSRDEFKNLCVKFNSPWRKDLEDIYSSGYLSCLKNFTPPIRYRW